MHMGLWLPYVVLDSEARKFRVLTVPILSSTIGQETDNTLHFLSADYVLGTMLRTSCKHLI